MNTRVLFQLDKIGSNVPQIRLLNSPLLIITFDSTMHPLS